MGSVSCVLCEYSLERMCGGYQVVRSHGGRGIRCSDVSRVGDTRVTWCESPGYVGSCLRRNDGSGDGW